MKKLGLYLFAIAVFGTCLSAAGYAQTYYVVQDAFKKASLPKDSKGYWVVKADVNIFKPDGTLLIGSGNLALSGKNGNVLEANLPLTKQKKGLSGESVYIYILNSDPMTVRVRHDVAGKPYLGRPAEVVTFEKQTFRAPYPRGKVIWDGEECTISFFLSPDQTPNKPTPAFPNPDPIPAAKKPVGARYMVTGYMEVTNAEDGLLGADNTCEIYGTIWIKLVDKNKKNYGDRKVFTLVPQDAMKGFKLNFDKNLLFDRYFDVPNWSYFHIEGSIFDSDGGMANTGDHDRLWETRKGLRFASLPTDPVGKVIKHTIPGDRKSENAEVYITITKVADLFEKP